MSLGVLFFTTALLYSHPNNCISQTFMQQPSSLVMQWWWTLIFWVIRSLVRGVRIQI